MNAIAVLLFCLKRSPYSEKSCSYIPKLFSQLRRDMKCKALSGLCLKVPCQVDCVQADIREQDLHPEFSLSARLRQETLVKVGKYCGFC